VNDDSTIIRHLHDLAALETQVAASPQFGELLRRTVAVDSDRGDKRVPADPRERPVGMLERLRSDALWAVEYEALVRQVSFAKADEEITFTEGLIASERIVASVYE
jgi:hypothetical protein